MAKLNELRQNRAKLHDRNKELIEIMEKPLDERPGKITDEQVSDEYETNEAAIAKLDPEIVSLEKWGVRRQEVEARDKTLAASAGIAAPPHGETPAADGTPSPLDGDDVRHGVHTDQQSPKYLSHMKRQYYGSLANIRGIRNGQEPAERAYRLGMWGLYCASKSLPNRYNFANAVNFVNEQGMIVHGEGAGDTSGAHVTVPDEFSADLIDLKEQRGVVRQLFGREAMMRETKTVPRRTGGLTAYAVGESAAGTESDMTLDDIMLIARKWMVVTRMSKELDEDNAINFGDKLAGEISYAFADKEDEAGFNGDGTSTYHGILGARVRMQDVDLSGTNSAGLITGAGNAYSELTLADFESVCGTLPDYADNDNTSWVVHRLVYYTVLKRLELAAGGATASEIAEGTRRPRPLFLGYPVVFSQVMPSAAGNSQVCALLGDFNTGAKFGDRRDESIEFDDTVVVGGQSVWERDQIAVKGTERMDINVHEFGSSSVSGAIVGLETAAA